jgi:uncharacterized protein (TIGR00255 family)
MTGFGSAEGPVAGGRIGVEIRTVNHRHFNFAPKLPGDFAPLEGEIRERLRREFDRGHVALFVRWTEAAPSATTDLVVDVERARLVAARLGELRQAAGLGGEISVELVARQPDVLRTVNVAVAEPTWAEVEPVVAAAAAECRRMRMREGAVLAAELSRRLALIAEAADDVERLAPARLVRERDRLAAAVRDLTQGLALDEARLAQEIALFADRLDITEELVRLRAHVDAAHAALAADRAVGKELGFLAQELGREVNTIGSKANDAVIAARVIAMKSELEKIREQLENLE